MDIAKIFGIGAIILSLIFLLLFIVTKYEYLSLFILIFIPYLVFLIVSPFFVQLKKLVVKKKYNTNKTGEFKKIRTNGGKQ